MQITINYKSGSSRLLYIPADTITKHEFHPGLRECEVLSMWEDIQRNAYFVRQLLRECSEDRDSRAQIKIPVGGAIMFISRDTIDSVIIENVDVFFRAYQQAFDQAERILLKLNNGREDVGIRTAISRDDLYLYKSPIKWA